MRFNPQEIAGSRVRMHYSVGLDYVVKGPSEFVLDVHAAHTARQVVCEEYFSVTPWRGVALSEDPVTRSRLAVFTATSGTIAVRYAAMVEITHRIVDPTDIVAAPPSALGASKLRYLKASRFCQADLLAARLGPVRNAAAGATGRCARFVNGLPSIRFEPGGSSASTSAVDTLSDGAACAATSRTR